MAFTSAVNEGPIPEEFVDQEVVGRTLRVYLTAKVNSTKDLIGYLKQHVPEFTVTDCQGVWRTERYGQLYVTMKDRESAAKLLELKCVYVGSDKVFFYNYGTYVIPLRIHWIHATVKSEFIKHYFSRYGKVLDVLREFEEIDGVSIFSGVRIVKMELTESEKANIPHIVKFGDKQSMLITAPGRMPICLKCHTHGHVRAKCPNNVPDSRPRRTVVESSDSEDSDGMETGDSDSDPPPVKTQDKKRKQSQDTSATQAKETDQATGKKKKAQDTSVPTSPLSWAERSSQSDAVLAALSETEMNVSQDTSTPASVSATPMKLPSVSERTLKVSDIFKRSWLEDNKDLVKCTRSTWKSWNFRVKIYWDAKKDVFKVTESNYDVNNCVTAFPEDTRKAVKSVIHFVLEQKVNLNKEKMEGEDQVKFKEVFLLVNEGEIKSFL